MKKRTLFTLVLAMFLIIVSGFSSISLFRQLVTEREMNTLEKTYKYDNSEELVITIKNNATLDLSASSDESVHLKKETTIFQTKKTDNTDWSVKKKNNQTSITITNQAPEYSSHFSLFNSSGFYDNRLYLSIPKNYKNIIVNGASIDVNVHDINLKNIALKIENGDVSVCETAVDTLTIDNTSGDTHLYEANISNDVSIESTSGSIDIDESTFSTLKATLGSGEASSNNTDGDMTITNKNGNITVNENKGKATLTSENGNVNYLAYKTYSDVAIESLLGDIQIGLSEPDFKKDKVELTTQLGDISIFDESLDSETTYSKKTGSTSIKATSTNGNILIYEADEDNMDYEYE